MARADNSAHLVPAGPGNSHATRHGIYSESGRALEPRARQITETLMSLPHVSAMDSIAAEEIGALLARIEALDEDLATAKGRTRQSLLDFRLRATRQLRDWLKEFGGTPKSRAELGDTLAHGGLMAEFARNVGRQP